MKQLIFTLTLVFMVLSARSADFTSSPIPDTIWHQMQGKSYHYNKQIRRTDLRYLQILHVDKEGKIHHGQLICHQSIAQDLLDIFRELYKAKYPIERVQLMDQYDGNDERSMRANNTSCFNYRKVAGSSKLSAHSRGMAIDLNPLYNPYYKKYKSGREKIQPSCARTYINRKADYPYKIEKGDLCYRLFIAHGFKWGGAWRSVKDYQHFEK